MRIFLLLLLLSLLPLQADAGWFYGATAAPTCSEELKVALADGQPDYTTIGKDDANDWVHVVGSYTVGGNWTITKLVFSMLENGTASGNLVANIWSDNSGTPSAIVDNGTSSTVDGSAIGTNRVDVVFVYTEGNRPTLSNGVTYHFGVTAPGVSATAWWTIYFDSTDSYGTDHANAVPSWSAIDNSSLIQVDIYGCQ